MFGLVWDVFVDTPTGTQRGPPSTSFARAEQLGVRLRSTRYARLRSASTQMGEAGGKKDKLQKQFYTGLRFLGYKMPWEFGGESVEESLPQLPPSGEAPAAAA